MKSTPKPFKNVPNLQELKRDFPALKALFFDMDGTLFDTEGIHADAMLMMAKKYQIRPPFSPEEVHALMLGKADHFVFEIIKSWEGVPSHWTAKDFIDEKNINIIELLKIKPSHGWFSLDVQKLLKESKTDGLFIALVTSSEKLITEELIRIVELDQFFDIVLTRNDCPKHKPDPWPYFEALKLSSFEKHEVIIFEDSLVGLEAATTSGCHVGKVEWY